MHYKSSHPGAKKKKKRKVKTKYDDTEDRRDSYGLTHNMGMSTHPWKEVEAQFKAKPGYFIGYIFPTVYFIMMTHF